MNKNLYKLIAIFLLSNSFVFGNLINGFYSPTKTITNTLTFGNLSNSNYSSNKSLGVNVNYNLEDKKVENAQEKPQQKGISSVGYNASNSLSANASKTLATLGQGNVTVKDIENSDELDRLNRDTENINKDLYSSSTGTKVDATLDTRLLTKDGQEQIAKDFDTAKKDWYAIYKVVDAYISDESKEKLKDLLKGDINSISQKDKEAIKDMKASALKQGYNVDKMTTEEKINLLEKLSGDMYLTTEQKQLRDAIWVSNIPLSEDWNNMRNTHIESIVDNSVKSKNFWITEQSWESMAIEDKQKFLQNYNDQNRLLIGNPLSAKVIIDNIDGQGQTMARYSSFPRGIKVDAPDIGNFYNTINLITHEGSGHGYQDYAISNKSDYLNIHPAQKDDVKILGFSYNWKMAPNKFLEKNHGVYLSDPAEQDAWKMGDTVEKKFKKRKVNENNIKNSFISKFYE
ncbi:hypothetical protein D3M61_02620 [Aliarcobacter butzleri]|uniref:hypothetical protein n=1 Tax=Aliarcobacter butzleri TaxID=28197 RepID=UPI00102D7C03|nr:hypothetical protein [Aliarcobacter butzleri]RZV14872.1 hypothetical protein D3M61_02620 [Aliarcobacter butzleri]